MNNINNSSNFTISNTKRNLPLYFYRSQATVIAQVTSLAIFGIITLLGNLASIITFAKTQSLRRRSNFMIINLSLADLTVSIIIFMVAYFFSLEPFTQPLSFVYALNTVDLFTGTTSLLGLTVISVERFYAIVFPFKHRMLRFKHYLVMCLAPWLSAVVLVLTYVGLDFPGIGEKLEYYNSARISFLCLSLTIMIVSYLGIWMKSRHANPSAQNQNRTLHDKKLSLTLFIVTLASLSTWLPYQLYFMSVIFGKVSLPHFNYFFAMKFLQYINSAINFFIYILRMRDFRSGFRAIFCGKRERSKPPQSTTTSNLSLSFTKQKAYAVNNEGTAAEGGLDASNLQLRKLTTKF
ncbi:octopamine receptor beta-2R-like [Exaiptasia diaphana]|uniref:G-protein coupled receptors family 1 profile domain-containing protein n=1 Tax=Exaiptasia diaphana TaxID=2652724 RepID=A0A913XZ04_EXADI|nr:octopamine receptor beta-2R-like [Exaiptasia diaphana]